MRGAFACTVERPDGRHAQRTSSGPRFGRERAPRRRPAVRVSGSEVGEVPRASGDATGFGPPIRPTPRLPCEAPPRNICCEAPKRWKICGTTLAR
jgi:hypothetical protein